MQTLIIYDDLGYIISQRQGEPLPREPQGIPFLWVEVPIEKQTKGLGSLGVDVSVTPNVAFLEDIPLTDLEVAEKRIKNAEEMINMLMFA